MLKIKTFITAVLCTALVMGSAGMAGAKQSQGKGPGKDGPAKVIMVDQADGKIKGKAQKKSKKEFFGENYAPGPVFKHGRVLIPVNAITSGLGASITWNMPDSVKIEKDGKCVEIDLVKGVALVNGTSVNLIKNGNGRIVLSPGLIKKLLGSAINEALPAVIADDIIMGLDEEKEFTVSSTNPQSGTAYQRASHKFTLANATLSDVTSFQYKEGDTWKNITLSQSGSSVVGYSGPAAGFALPENYSASTTFRLKMARIGTYNVDISLVNLDSNEAIIARDSIKVNVNTWTAAAIAVGDLSLFAGEERDFGISATNPLSGKNYQRTLFKFSVANATLSDISEFQYREGDTWKSIPLIQNGSSLVGYSGPVAGFSLPANYSSTTTFRLKMSRVGTFNMDIKLVDLDDSEATIAQDSMNVTVNADDVVITAVDQTINVNQANDFSVMTANPLYSRSYDRVMFKFTVSNAVLSDIAQFQYLEGGIWRNISLSQIGSSVVGYSGLSGGVTLPANYSTATTFRLNMTRVGNYMVDIKLVDLNNSENTIAQDSMNITVQ